MILQVKEVSKRFGGLQALTNVTFDLPEGPDFGPHRPQRRRQNHPVQRD